MNAVGRWLLAVAVPACLWLAFVPSPQLTSAPWLTAGAVALLGWWSVLWGPIAAAQLRQDGIRSPTVSNFIMTSGFMLTTLIGVALLVLLRLGVTGFIKEMAGLAGVIWLLTVATGTLQVRGGRQNRVAKPLVDELPTMASHSPPITSSSDRRLTHDVSAASDDSMEM